MPLFRRPKPSPHGWFDQLPDDIVILVCCQCQVNDLVALQLTSSRIRNLISEYISTIAPSVAHATFSHHGYLFKPPPEASTYTLKWLNNLIPQLLAAILVEKYNPFAPEYRHGIPANHPAGEKIRASVANGWRVLRRLTLISEQVYQMDAKDVDLGVEDVQLESRKRASNWTNVLTKSSALKYFDLKKREKLIAKRRLEYISALSQDKITDYRSLFLLLSTTFRTTPNIGDEYHPWVFDFGEGIDSQRLLRQGKSWMTWFILNQGPNLFWQQWCALPPDGPQTKNYIRDKSVEVWLEHSEISPEGFMDTLLPMGVGRKVYKKDDWLNDQRTFGTRVHQAIADQSNTDDSRNAHRFFSTVASIRRESATAPIQDTFGHVPFYVDFRCPPGSKTRARCDLLSC